MVTAPYKRLNLFSFNFGTITILHVISSYGSFLFFSIAADLYIYFTGSIFFYFFVGLIFLKKLWQPGTCIDKDRSIYHYQRFFTSHPGLIDRDDGETGRKFRDIQYMIRDSDK